MKDWVTMPSKWLIDQNRLPLASLKWVGSQKSDRTAALMLYIVITHHAHEQSGECSITYTELNEIIGISRAKISGGLKVLIELGVIALVGGGRNNRYKLLGFDPYRGWAKLPARRLYDIGYNKIDMFHHFKLRSKTELNALKIYLLLLAFRDRQSNHARIRYERITMYTGVHRNDIKVAISLLVTNNLLYVDTEASDAHKNARFNMYYIRYIERQKRPDKKS